MTNTTELIADFEKWAADKFPLNSLAGKIAWDAWQAAHQAGRASAVPEGFVLMPRKLTAENGAKAALSGEFAEKSTHICPSCNNEEEDREECEICNGEGVLIEDVPVQWTTIKAIYRKAVAVCAAAPQEKEGV